MKSGMKYYLDRLITFETLVISSSSSYLGVQSSIFFAVNIAVTLFSVERPKYFNLHSVAMVPKECDLRSVGHHLKNCT